MSRSMNQNNMIQAPALPFTTFTFLSVFKHSSDPIKDIFLLHRLIFLGGYDKVPDDLSLNLFKRKVSRNKIGKYKLGGKNEFND